MPSNRAVFSRFSGKLFIPAPFHIDDKNRKCRRCVDDGFAYIDSIKSTQRSRIYLHPEGCSAAAEIGSLRDLSRCSFPVGFIVCDPTESNRAIRRGAIWDFLLSDNSIDVVIQRLLCILSLNGWGLNPQGKDTHKLDFFSITLARNDLSTS